MSNRVTCSSEVCTCWITWNCVIRSRPRNCVTNRITCAVVQRWSGNGSGTTGKKRSSRLTASTLYFPGAMETASTSACYFLCLRYKLHLRRKQQENTDTVFAIRSNNAGCQVGTAVLLRAQVLCKVLLRQLLNTYRRFEAPTAWH
jgi:hypothetical protein